MAIPRLQLHFSRNFAIAVSVALGSRATAQTVLPSTVAVPWGANENLYESFTTVIPGTSYALRLAFSSPYATDTVAGLETDKLWYQVLNPATGQMDTIRPLIESGADYSQTHPISTVYIEPPTRQNSFVTSASPPIILSNGEIAVPFEYWKLNGNMLEHASDAYTFTRGGVLLGTWNAAHSDLSWSVGYTGGLDFTKQSSRGEIEPSIVELDQPGRLLMSIRGSNEGNTALPGQAWKAVSNDYGKTWANTSTLNYSDGTSFYSPSAMSTVIRNNANQKVYWIGNIIGSNPNGDSPRYPLVIGEVDQGKLGIIKSSVQTIATRNSATQSTSVEYSNFAVNESPLTGQFTIAVPVEDNGVTSNQFFVSNLPITKTAPTPVDDSTNWKLRYEGNVLPTQAGAIQYSTGANAAFGTLYANPSTGTDGNLLHLSTPTVGAALLTTDTKVPSSTGATMKLDPAIGYTVEFRARLNSITGTDTMTGAAAVQIPNGVTGGNAETISLIDPNGSAAGKAVAWAGAENQTAYSVPDGFNTYRLTVKDTVAKLYADGVLLGTDVSGGATNVTSEIRVGDFTDSAGADWDLDYLRVYDQGAIAPLTPPSTWVTNGSDIWSASANWSSITPNAVDAVANLMGAINSPRTVVADSAVTVGTLRFNNAYSYQIAGQGSLTIDVSTGAGSIDVQQGSHKINLPLFINDNTTVSVATGASLKISNPMTLLGGATLTKIGSGTLSIEAPVLSSTSATLVALGGVLTAATDLGPDMSVQASGGVTSFATSQHLAALSVSGGSVLVGPGANVVLVTNNLSIADSGKIDLQNNKMVIDYSGDSPLALVRNLVASGSLSSSLLVPGTGIGVGEASDLYDGSAGMFGGQGVNASSVLVAYTITADANLDGTVDSTDFALLSSHYGQLDDARWTQGDFNGDGSVNALDFNLLATNFGVLLQPSSALETILPEPGMAFSIVMLFNRLTARRTARVRTGENKAH